MKDPEKRPLALRAAADRFDGVGRGLPALDPVLPGRAAQAGPFRVRFVHVTHSTPQSCALIVETPAGRIVHSGDFRLDPTPLRWLGLLSSDAALLRRALELAPELDREELDAWLPVVAAVRLCDNIPEIEGWLLKQIRWLPKKK